MARPRGAARLAEGLREGALRLTQDLVDRGGGEDPGAEVANLYAEALVLAFRLTALDQLDGEPAGATEGALRGALGVDPAHGTPSFPATTPTLAGRSWGDDVAARFASTVIGAAEGSTTDGAELGRALEALAHLEPGYAAERSVRLEHKNGIDAVVPCHDRAASGPASRAGDVAAGQVYLRSGHGRKSAGAYFTPEPLRRFLTTEVLGPILGRGDPELRDPGRILEVRVLDPAMGAGHFLIEASRQLGRALHESLGRGAAEEPLPAGLHRGDDEATCRALVAKRCLFGVDRSTVAAEVARLALFLETGGRVSPRELAGRLVVGDALTGPWRHKLAELPVSGESVSPRLSSWLRHEGGGAAGHRLASLWTGSVVDGTARGDRAYVDALEAAAAGRRRQSDTTRKLEELGGDALPLDQVFSEVFDRDEGGFDAILGNPPWDKVIPLERELFARFDPGVLAVPTARERAPVYAELRRRPEVQAAWDDYTLPFRRTSAMVARTYEHQGAGQRAGGGRKQGHGDGYRYFVERAFHCLRQGGRLGLVLPAAVYANAGATGVRQLLLGETRLELCLGFVNRRRIFDAAAGMRFALVVAERGGRTEEVKAAFGLDEPECLDQGSWRDRAITLGMDLIERTSPEHLCFPECESPGEADAARRILAAGAPWGRLARTLGIKLRQELNMTTDSPRFTTSEAVLRGEGFPPETDPRLEPARSELLRKGWLVVHEKGTFYGYDDLLKDRPRYLCSAAALDGTVADHRPRPRALSAARFYRLALRATVHASERDKVVLALLPPGVVVGNSALAELAPEGRPNTAALLLLAVGNARPVGFAARLRVMTNVNQFLLDSLPVPELDEPARRFVVHGALRLCCRHEAYRPLWEEQLGEGWAEAGPAMDWPAVAEGPARMELTAAIDGVVAHALGLDRRGYEDALAAFGPALPKTFSQSCLSMFDAIGAEGLETVAESLDPYGDLPLSEELPRSDDPRPWA